MTAQQKKDLLNAFIAGFSISGEGWNAEYPFENKPAREMRKKLTSYFESWYKTHIASATPAEVAEGEVRAALDKLAYLKTIIDDTAPFDQLIRVITRLAHARDAAVAEVTALRDALEKISGITSDFTGGPAHDVWNIARATAAESVAADMRRMALNDAAQCCRDEMSRARNLAAAANFENPALAAQAHIVTISREDAASRILERIRSLLPKATTS